MLKFVKIAIYGIWGLFLCIAAMEKFSDFFAAGSGFSSVVMLTVAGVCQLAAGLIAIGWAVLAFGSFKSKYLSYKLVNNYTVPVLIIGLALVASMARSSSDESRAQKLGFKDSKTFAVAREHNITNITDYAKFEEEQRIEKAQKIAHDAELATEKAQQDNIANYLVLFPEDERKERARELISSDLKQNPALTQKILKEMESYSAGSVERDVAEGNYLDYGVGLKQYDSALDASSCRQRYQNGLFPINEWQKAQHQLLKETADSTNWDLLDEYQKKHQRKQFLYEHDKVTLEFFKEKNVIQKSFNSCVFNLLSSIPERLSRPKAEPVPVTDIIPDGIACMRKSNGSVDLCY